MQIKWNRTIYAPLHPRSCPSYNERQMSHCRSSSSPHPKDHKSLRIPPNPNPNPRHNYIQTNNPKEKHHHHFMFMFIHADCTQLHPQSLPQPSQPLLQLHLLHTPRFPLPILLHFLTINSIILSKVQIHSLKLPLNQIRTDLDDHYEAHIC